MSELGLHSSNERTEELSRIATKGTFTKHSHDAVVWATSEIDRLNAELYLLRNNYDNARDGHYYLMSHLIERIQDCELALGVYDDGHSSEYWLRHPTPAKDEQWEPGGSLGNDERFVKVSPEASEARSECPYCQRPVDSQGGIYHVSDCAGLKEVVLNQLQYDALSRGNTINEPCGHEEAKLALPADPQELLVRAAADAGFSDAQWKSMFYEKGPYDVTFPSFTTKKFVALLLERLQASPNQLEAISIGSAPQTHDVSSYDGEHGLSPRPGHGTASGQRTTRADTNASDLNPDEVVEALKQACQECACTLRERESGHRVECSVPHWQEMIGRRPAAPPRGGEQAECPECFGEGAIPISTGYERRVCTLCNGSGKRSGELTNQDIKRLWNAEVDDADKLLTALGLGDKATIAEQYRSEGGFLRVGKIVNALKASPEPPQGDELSDPPGLRVGAKPGEAQATARKTPVETASLPVEPPAAPPFNALLNFAEWCLGAPEEAEHMVAHIKANARYAIDQWNSVTKTRHPAMNCPHCDGITPRGVLEHAPGCPAKDGHQ